MPCILMIKIVFFSLVYNIDLYGYHALVALCEYLYLHKIETISRFDHLSESLSKNEERQ